MFYSASAFNQDLSKWCVVKIPAPGPESFDSLAEVWLLAGSRPVWGNTPCP